MRDPQAPPAVRLRTAGVESGEDLTALRATLAVAGWDLQIDTQSPVRRSAVAELVVHIFDAAPHPALDGLESMLIHHVRASLPRQHNHRGRVVIYGADEVVLRLCEVTQAA